MASREKPLPTDDVRSHQGSKLPKKEGTFKTSGSKPGSDSEFKRKKMINGDDLDGERPVSKKRRISNEETKVSDGDKKNSGKGRISLAESSEKHKTLSGEMKKNATTVGTDNKDLGKVRLSSKCGENRRNSLAGAGLSGKVMNKMERRHSDCVDDKRKVFDVKTKSSAKVRVSSGEMSNKSGGKQRNPGTKAGLSDVLQKKRISGSLKIEGEVEGQGSCKAQGKIHNSVDKGKLVVNGDKKDSSRVRLSSGGSMDKSGETRTESGVVKRKLENLRDNSGRKPANSAKSDVLRKQPLTSTSVEGKSVAKNKSDTSQVWKWWIIYSYVATWLLMESIHWELRYTGFFHRT